MEGGGAWRRGGAARGWCIEAAVTMKREEKVAKLCFHVILLLEVQFLGIILCFARRRRAV